MESVCSMGGGQAFRCHPPGSPTPLAGDQLDYFRPLQEGQPRDLKSKPVGPLALGVLKSFILPASAMVSIAGSVHYWQTVGVEGKEEKP